MTNKPWVGKSVLIIDDSSGVRDELTKVFTNVGLVVKGSAANGVIGLEMLRTLKPDVSGEAGDSLHTRGEIKENLFS